MASSVNPKDHRYQTQMAWGAVSNSSRDPPLSVGLYGGNYRDEVNFLARDNVHGNYVSEKEHRERASTTPTNREILVHQAYAYEMMRKECTSVDMNLSDPKVENLTCQDFVTEPNFVQSWITDCDADTEWDGPAGDGEYTISVAENSHGLPHSIRIAVHRPPEEGKDRTLLMVGYCLNCMLAWLVAKLEQGLPCLHYIDPPIRVPDDAKLIPRTFGFNVFDKKICTVCDRRCSNPYSTDGAKAEWRHKLLCPKFEPTGREEALTLIKAAHSAVLDNNRFSPNPQLRLGIDYKARVVDCGRAEVIVSAPRSYTTRSRPASEVSIAPSLPSGLMEEAIIDPAGMTVLIPYSRGIVNAIGFFIALMMSMPTIAVPREDNGAFAVALATLVMTISLFMYATLPPIFYPGASLQDFNEGTFTSKRLDQVVTALKPWFFRRWLMKAEKIEQEHKAILKYVYHKAYSAALSGKAKVEGPHAALFPANDSSTAVGLTIREVPPLLPLHNWNGVFTFIQIFDSDDKPEDMELISAISFRGKNCQLTIVPLREHGWSVIAASGTMSKQFPHKAGMILGRVIGNIHNLTHQTELRFSDQKNSQNWRKQLTDRLGKGSFHEKSKRLDTYPRNRAMTAKELSRPIVIEEFCARIAEEYLDFEVSGKMPIVPQADLFGDRYDLPSPVVESI